MKTQDTQKKLFLLDAYALIFRSYYAFIKNPRYNSKGINTSAIFGFINTLYEILVKERPTHIAVVFDPPPPNFRNELFPEYKANREETPEDILKSTPIIKQIIEAFNIPVIEVPGYEADDTIGTLAKKAKEKGFVTYMMTSDKDYYQLIDNNIYIYKPKRSGGDVEIVDFEGLMKKFEVQDPKQVIDILAIWGDTSDNIPGIPGVGEKTAKKLIKQFGSVENLFKNTNKLKGKQKENVEKSADLVKLSKELVTIRTDVPIEFDEEKFRIKPFDKERLKKLFEELEFNNLAKRILGEEISQQGKPVQGTLFDMQPLISQTTEKTTENINTVEHNYQLTDTPEKRKILIDKLLKTKEFCFDTETDSIHAIEASLVGMSFAVKEFEAYYVPVPASKDEAQKIIDEFRPVFENNAVKIGQNLKYDITVLRNYGIRVKGEFFDTMVAHYLLHPELRHNMDFLAETYLNYSPVSIETLIGKKGKNQGSMRNVALEKIKDYACEDADVTLRLKPILEEELTKNKMINLAREIEMPLIKVLADMEYQGVSIDIEFLKKYSKTLREKIIAIEEEIYSLAGIRFNISSTKQLGEVLFVRLKVVSNPKLTKTKQYSTSEEELLKIKDKHPIVEKILEFRSLKKLLTTYVDALPKLINKQTGKIHTSFNQTVTATGRLSSNNPNLQNIPIRTEDGRQVRKAFVPTHEQGYIFDADYSQIELRIMAHLSGDENMIKAFEQGEDIHTATAAKIFGVKKEDVTREMRTQAKSANFGIIYAISSFGLAQNLGITRSEAKKLIDNYFATYPKVKEYMDRVREEVQKTSEVVTLFGRRRFLPDVNSRNATVRNNALRNAINTPIQGTAADIIKIAMIKIHNRLKQENLHSKMILQVHDELVFDTYPNELDKLKQIVVQEMENAAKLSVKLVTDTGYGKNWLEAH